MPDFKSIQSNLQQLRSSAQRDKQALFLARQQRKRIAEREKALSRIFNPQNDKHQQRKERLESQRRDIENDINKWQSAISEAGVELADWTGTFLQFSDPREHVEEMDDRSPILLFPLRIETRFKQLEDDGETFNQLWVRVFPDECMVDNFQEALSEMELKSAASYWTARWRAGGIEADDRAAWRSLVANHGTGRAAWIHQNYEPVSGRDIPQKTSAEQVFLIISGSELPVAADRPVVEKYWVKSWQSYGNSLAQQTAFQKLVDAVGDVRAAEITNLYTPVNFKDLPAEGVSHTDTDVSVHWLELPDDEQIQATQQSWSQPPRSYVLPDRLVLRLQAGSEWSEHIGNTIPQPLTLGIDPSAEEDALPQKNEGQIELPEDIRWMEDFNEAVKIGLGFRIDLNSTQAIRGFSKIQVLGLRLSADQAKSKELLEQLFDHHHYSSSGMELIPQGTPTNNTESMDSGYSYLDDANKSYDRYVLEVNTLELQDDDKDKQDGQWLAENLFIDPEVVADMANANGRDQRTVRAMNTALWPSTLGYYMDAMMGEVFSRQDRNFTRTFFTDYVQGSGNIPAIRIGDQPYGILPTTAWSKMQWIDDWLNASGTVGGANFDPWVRHVKQTYDILKKVDEDWAELMTEVSHVGKRSTDLDPQQMLLDIVGLHPSSAEFYQRYAMTSEQLFNMFSAYGFGGFLTAFFIGASYVKSGTDLLSEFGINIDGEKREIPEILSKFFLKKQTKLSDLLVDDRPLSEIEGIRAYTDDEKNYLQWLKEAAESDLEIVRKQTGFTDNKRPTAILYKLLRHGLQLSYWDSAYRLYEAVDTDVPYRLSRKEPAFVHIQEQEASFANKYELLYREDTAITETPGLTIAAHISNVLQFNPHAKELREVVASIAHLENESTASLSRALESHIDCCTYRLDAWKQALVNIQLDRMHSMQNTGRDDTSSEAAAGINRDQGLYLGAYGWLEDVRPEGKTLEPVELSDELAEIFNAPTQPPLTTDDTNQGYIHAPSLNHAVTAAILRNGYLSNATPDQPGLMGVNLSSERVRQAMLIIEGIRQGQSLGALLGYQFERDLHDNEQLAETDEFIYDLRKKFPMVSDNLEPTRSNPDDSIKLIEARNVIDGVKFIDHVQEIDNFSYPFGYDDLPDASGPQAAKINAALNRIRNINDAVADLAIAESVHQATLGNIDRAAAGMDAYSKGGLPTIPQVVQTPRSGKSLTHRFALHLNPTADHTVSPWAGIQMSVRAQAEPGVNAWIAGLLPDPTKILVHVQRMDNETIRPITVTQLQLQPIDLLFLLQLEVEQQMNELDDRILVRYLELQEADGDQPRPDVELRILYRQKGAIGQINLFELSPLVFQLRSLLLSARPLQSSDISLSNEASKKEDNNTSLNTARIDSAQQDLAALVSDIGDYVNVLEPMLADSEANRDALIDNTETRISEFISLASSAGKYRLLNAGRGFVFAWKRQFFETLLEKMTDLTNTWQTHLDEFEAAMIEYNALLPAVDDEIRFQKLHALELLVSTSFTPTEGQTVVGIEAIVNAKRAAFETKRNSIISNVVNIDTTSVNVLLNAAKAEMPLNDFRHNALDLEEQEQQLIAFNDELLRIGQALFTEMDDMQTAVSDNMAIINADAEMDAKIKASQSIAKLLFGDDFMVVPQFTLPVNSSEELSKLTAPSSLLDHLTSNNISVFPMDEWLYGLARVRSKMKHWEQLSFLTEGFTGNEPALRPAQLPFRENDHWLGMEFPDDYSLESDKLLYTAHHAVAFDPFAAQCGLLLDEWTETIPDQNETTGITFHYDTPNSEPPQTMLLVTPTRFRGGWEWNDLTDALEETLDNAKKRAIEPDMIDDTAYARFLPAAVMTVVKSGILMSLNLSEEN